MNNSVTAKELRHAAILLEDHMIAGLETMQHHEFSQAFQLKMEPLLTKSVREEKSRRVLQTIAASLAVVILCVFSWLATHAEAREAVQRWVREIWQNNVVYRFLGEASFALPDTRPAWLPEGYVETEVDYREDLLSVMYQNENDDIIIYITGTMKNGKKIDIVPAPSVDFREENVNIRGLPGTLYVSESEQSILLWMDDVTGVYYSICANADSSVILHMADSVDSVKTTKKK